MMLRLTTAHTSVVIDELAPDVVAAVNPAHAWLSSRSIFHVGQVPFFSVIGTDQRAPRVIAVGAIQAIEVVA